MQQQLTFPAAWCIGAIEGLSVYIFIFVPTLVAPSFSTLYGRPRISGREGNAEIPQKIREKLSQVQVRDRPCPAPMLDPRGNFRRFSASSRRCIIFSQLRPEPHRTGRQPPPPRPTTMSNHDSESRYRPRHPPRRRRSRSALASPRSSSANGFDSHRPRPLVHNG